MTQVFEGLQNDVEQELIRNAIQAITNTVGEIKTDDQIEYDNLRAIVSDLYALRDPTRQQLLNNDPEGILGTLTTGLVKIQRGELTAGELDYRVLRRIERHNRRSNAVSDMSGGVMTAPEERLNPIDQGAVMSMTSELMQRMAEQAIGKPAMAGGEALVGYVEAFRRWEEVASNPIMKKSLQSIVGSLDYLVNRFGRRGASIALGGGILAGGIALKEVSRHLATGLTDLWNYMTNVKGFEKVNNDQNFTNSSKGSWTHEGTDEAGERLGDNKNKGQSPLYNERLAELIQSLVNKINGAEIKANDIKSLKMTVGLLEKNINNSRLNLLFSKEYENNLLSVLRRKIGEQLLRMNEPSLFSRSAIQNRSTRPSTNTWAPIGYPPPPY